MLKAGRTTKEFSAECERLYFEDIVAHVNDLLRLLWFVHAQKFTPTGTRRPAHAHERPR
jgi:hypothetical protein